jgi:dCTP deaminase
MILGHHAIKNGYNDKSITIEPYDENRICPNSYDVILGRNFKRVECNSNSPFEYYIDPKLPQQYTEYKDMDSVTILPGELWIAHTVEKIGSTQFVPMLEGRSSIGRMGLFVHVTAGFGDVGFVDQWTFELASVKPIMLYSGMRIAQVFFHTMTDNDVQYSGRYVGQTGAQESRFAL